MGIFEQFAMSVVRAGVHSMTAGSRRRGGGTGCLLLVAVIFGAFAIVGVLVT